MTRNILLIALATAFFIAPAAAQEAVQLVQVLTVAVKPGKDAQFEEFVRAFREASSKQGLDNYWVSAQSVSGEPVYRFHMNRSAWADLAKPGPALEQAFGAKEAARLTGLLSESVESEHAAFFREAASMSYVPANGFDPPPEGLLYYDFMLNPGTAPMFQEMVTAQKAASSALYPNDYFVVSLPDFGATGPRTILLLNHFSDLDRSTLPPGQRLTRHFGQEEGARLNQLAGQSIAGFTATLFRTRPDLNYQPPE